MNLIYAYTDYKAYLHAVLASSPAGGHGVRKVWAEWLRCRTPYVTQVLNGNAHLSLEQAEALARGLGLLEAECDYFFLLVHSARAGTPELKKYFAQKREQVLREYRTLHSRIRKESSAVESLSLSESDQAVYYSSWHYAAVHMAATLSGMGRIETLAQKTGLSVSRTRVVVRFLLRTGILVQTPRSGFSVGRVRLHLDASSPWVADHHTHFRALTQLRLSQREPGREAESDLHYSSLVTLSEKDFKSLREEFFQVILRAKKKIAASPEEKMAVLCLDFYGYE